MPLPFKPEHAKKYIPSCGQPDRIGVANAADDNGPAEARNFIKTHQRGHLKASCRRCVYGHAVFVVIHVRSYKSQHHIISTVIIGGDDQRWAALCGGQVSEGESY